MNYFCFHKWGKWSDPFPAVNANHKAAQARRCDKCGKVHITYVRSPWNWWFDVRVVIDRLSKGVQS